jgi:predicted DNA-binding protein (MmcQ/YjbR family)
MKYIWIDTYCLSKNAVIKDYKIEWDATRYMIDSKMFVLIGQNKEKREIISLKLNPEYGEFLRNEYDDIKPGYYLNKEHWNSINLDGSVPDDLLKELVDQSYALVLHSLTKKRQSEIGK